MKKKLARLVVILAVVATCLLLILPNIPQALEPAALDLDNHIIETEIITEPTIEETTCPTEETIIMGVELLPLEEVADEVMAGKWGNGDARMDSLTAAGYNAEEIQAYINTLIPESQQNSIHPTVVLLEGEYPEATYVWNVMRSWGWSPETCAGIIGNIMAEIGGGTLDFSDWDSNGSGGYGMIQWLGGRRTLLKSRYGEYPSIDEQLIYMRDEMFGTNDTPRQISESVCNRIIHGTSPEDIAYLFADQFERCHNAYKSIRRSYARAAYNYFMN